MTLPLSVLDLAQAGAGTSATDALRATVDVARAADALGFRRFWLAEHHNLPGIASPAPEIMISHVADATSRIRVGAGGIMLPNHAPLKVAETFKLLAALHPDRIDLGLGRAPGTDPVTAAALRGQAVGRGAEAFGDQLADLLAFGGDGFPAGHPFADVRAIPGDVPLPPLWLLGSSGASADLAATAGVGYAFAHHIAAAPAVPSLRRYRAAFRPSTTLSQPHALLTVSVVCADTAERARELAAVVALMWVRIRTGRLGPPPTVEEALAHEYTPLELQVRDAFREQILVGDAATVRAAITDLAQASQADEVMVTTMVPDRDVRLRTLELLAEAFALTPRAA